MCFAHIWYTSFSPLERGPRQFFLSQVNESGYKDIRRSSAGYPFRFRSKIMSQGPDADDFNPGRFLDNQGNFVPVVGDTKDVYLETEGQKYDLSWN